MEPLLSPAEARAIDQDAVARGVPSLLLMENAGLGATRVLTDAMAGCLGAPLIVGGLGQNGGDAWVVARQLAVRGIASSIVVVGDPEKITGDARVNFDALAGLGLKVHAIVRAERTELETLLRSKTLIVDGLFGTGLDRPIEGFRAELLAALAASAIPSIALDLPSGLDGETGQVLGRVLPAKRTVTFAGMKRGLHQYPGVELAGAIDVVAIGVPPPSEAPAMLTHSADLYRWLAPRPGDAHKGISGRVSIFAGAPGRTGAALLSGLGAIRAGAGLVTIASRGAARAALDAKVIELMTLEIPEALEAGLATSLEHAETTDAAVLGPGSGTDASAKQYLLRLSLSLAVPTVLDADALTASSEDPTLLRGAEGPRVLTPHPGEAARMLGVSNTEIQADRYRWAAELARRSGQVVVLKGARSIVASPEGRMRVCAAGTPALAVGGTGDVLSGVIAAHLVSLAPFDAAAAGVLMHALAGEFAAQSDRGLFAREVADALPMTLGRYRRVESD